MFGELLTEFAKTNATTEQKIKFLNVMTKAISRKAQLRWNTETSHSGTLMAFKNEKWI